MCISYLYCVCLKDKLTNIKIKNQSLFILKQNSDNFFRNVFEYAISHELENI